jgi:hypothetical protein
LRSGAVTPAWRASALDRGVRRRLARRMATPFARAGIDLLALGQPARAFPKGSPKTCGATRVPRASWFHDSPAGVSAVGAGWGSWPMTGRCAGCSRLAVTRPARPGTTTAERLTSSPGLSLPVTSNSPLIGPRAQTGGGRREPVADRPGVQG